MKRDVTLRVTLEDLSLLAYTIPAERLRPLITDRLAAHTLDIGGSQRAIVSTICGRLRFGRRDSFLSRFTFGLASHCACVQWEEMPGVYDFRTVLTPPAPARIARLLVPTTRPGVSRALAPPEPPGILRYAILGPGDDFEIEVTQEQTEPPDANYQKILSFLTDRRQLYFWFRGRYLWRTPLDRPPLDLRPAQIRQVRIPVWQQTGLLSATELRTPSVVCWSPAVSLECRFPRPAIRL